MDLVAGTACSTRHDLGLMVESTDEVEVEVEVGIVVPCERAMSTT